MNTRLLRRIQKQILKEPKQFRMRWWFTREDGIPNCGTAACIAGWAIALSRKVNPAQAAAQCAGTVDPDAEGAKLLRLRSKNKIFALFGEGYWPDKFQPRFDESHKQIAQRAVRRIDHFIKTKGAE